MAIRAIALDIDGTLTNDEKRITPRTKKALLEVQEAGVTLILASGRPVQGLRALASELELEQHHGLIVAYNGARVVDAESDELLFNQPMSADDSRAVVEHMRGFDVIPWIVEDDQLYVERGMSHIIGHRGEPVDIVEYERRHCDLVLNEVDDLLELCDHPQDKILVAGTDTYLAEQWRAMREPFKDTLSCMFTADFYYEYMALGIDKGHALRFALPKRGIDAVELVAFGDGQNDVPMIELAGCGVAMGNAIDEAKQAATMVTASNNEDGIADALVELGLLG